MRLAVSIKPGSSKLFSSQDSLAVDIYKNGVIAQTLVLSHHKLDRDTWSDEEGIQGFVGLQSGTNSVLAHQVGFAATFTTLTSH
jgi:hypothetical protein